MKIEINQLKKGFYAVTVYDEGGAKNTPNLLALDVISEITAELVKAEDDFYRVKRKTIANIINKSGREQGG